MSVTYPLGFQAAGVTAGFKPSGQPDLGVLVGGAAAGVPIDPSRVDVAIGVVPVIVAGVIPPAYFEDDAFAERAREQMQGPEIAIDVRLGDGVGASRVFGCDLSYDYVRINAEYTT